VGFAGPQHHSAQRGLLSEFANADAEICTSTECWAIGGMTALYPSRDNPELNARALAVLAEDKKNEASCLMDGAWTGHPDQNEIAVTQFLLQSTGCSPKKQYTSRPAAIADGSR